MDINMLDINFNHSANKLSIDFNLPTHVKNKIFYVLHKGSKIFVKYIDSNRIIIPKKLIINKKVSFQIYWKEKGENQRFKSNLITFNEVEKRFFHAIISKKNKYHDIKRNGYSSIDKMKSTAIDESINWQTGHRNFDFNLNAWRFLAPYWGEFLESYDEKVLKEIVTIISSYHNHMMSKKAKANKFIWYDMATGIRALHISLVLQFKEFLSQDEIKLLERLHQNHLEKLLEERFFSLNNHGIWQVYGLRTLIYINKDSNLTALAYCNRRFSELVDASFNNEGVHTENSPFYHQYVTKLFKVIPKQLFSDNEKLADIVSDATNFSGWLSDANQQFFQIGDTESLSRTKLRIKDYIPDFSDRERQNFSKIFFDSGYLVIKSFDQKNICRSELAFYNTSDSIVHKHLDGNSFILRHNNIELFADAGKYTYDYGDFKKYFRSFCAHNCIYPENNEISLKDLNLSKSVFTNFEVTDYYKISSKVSYADYFENIRHLSYHANSKIVIEDEIKNSSGTNNVLNLLFGAGIEIRENLNKDYILLEYEGKAVAKLIIPRDFLSYNIYFGTKKPYKGWISKKYSISEAVFNLEVVYPNELKDLRTEILLLPQI